MQHQVEFQKKTSPGLFSFLEGGDDKNVYSYIIQCVFTLKSRSSDEHKYQIQNYWLQKKLETMVESSCWFADEEEAV